MSLTMPLNSMPNRQGEEEEELRSPEETANKTLFPSIHNPQLEQMLSSHHH